MPVGTRSGVGSLPGVIGPKNWSRAERRDEGFSSASNCSGRRASPSATLRRLVRRGSILALQDDHTDADRVEFPINRAGY
jgi:hypothetical protein